jgi:hypothetical protein
MRITTAGTWTQSQDTDVPSGQGFSNSCKCQCTTANASLSTNSAMNLQYRLEGQNLQHLKKGTANAESLTLSFWIKSNKTGTYQVNLNDNDNARIIGTTYTIDSADTWEKKILTFAGDTTGAFDNDNNYSFQLEWFFAVGTDFSSGSVPTSWSSRTNPNRGAGLTVNLADSTSNYINITGVQLEVGDTATPFEVVPYDVSLARCQRYYTRIGGNPSSSLTATRTLLGLGYSGTSTQITTSVSLPTTMRSQPTVNSGGTLLASGYNYSTAVSSVTFNQGGNLFNISVLANVSSTTVDLPRSILVRTDTDADSYVDFDAEL